MRSVDFRVSPVGGGWIIECPSGLAPLVVRSGARAEAKAEDLARAITAAGVDARVTIFDQAGRMVGAKRYWARS